MREVYCDTAKSLIIFSSAAKAESMATLDGSGCCELKREGFTLKPKLGPKPYTLIPKTSSAPQSLNPRLETKHPLEAENH